jgi:hypothetical protein
MLLPGLLPDTIMFASIAPTTYERNERSSHAVSRSRCRRRRVRGIRKPIPEDWTSRLPLSVSQRGQRLPTEVFSIIAKYLKDEQQDRACANLNETSRGVHAETLKDLWNVLRVRLSPHHDIGKQIERILCGEGAKYLRYVDILIDVKLAVGHFRLTECVSHPQFLHDPRPYVLAGYQLGLLGR